MIPRYSPTPLYLTKNDEDRGCQGEGCPFGVRLSCQNQILVQRAPK
jgi:hypothetical protein